MAGARDGQTVVIFLSVRIASDAPAYAAAAKAMEALARIQPGFRDFETARGGDGLGITLSFWANEAAAVAWRDQPDHASIRNAGRGRWYARYEVIVARAERSYAWTKA